MEPNFFSEIQKLLDLTQIEAALRNEIEKRLNALEINPTQDEIECSKKKSLINKELASIKKEIQLFKNSFAKVLINSQEMFPTLTILSKQNNNLAISLNQICLSYKTLFDKHLVEEFKVLYNIPQSTEIETLVKESGASEGFIMTNKEQKFYVKESLTYRREKKVNPKELLIYKLMEFAKFGPKTKFLLKLFLTSRTGANICYISSQDVEYTKDQNKIKTFFTDNMTDDFKLKQSEQWEEALNDEKFLIDLLALSILDDVLFLNDSFRSNLDNYGCLKIENTKTKSKKYKIFLIDHLPDCKNLKFDFDKKESFVLNFIHKLEINSSLRISRKKKPSLCLTLLKKNEIFIKNLKGLEKLAIRSLIMEEGKKINILEASKLAKTEIEVLITQDPDIFVDDGLNVLRDYFERVEVNINHLKPFLEKCYPEESKNEEK